MSKEFKYTLTDYGKKVKIRLLELNKSQEWLIKCVAQKTGNFVDCSLMNKILTGRVNSQVIISAINETLNIRD